MKWSLKLGRFLGIDVHLHFTFVLLLVFVGMANWLTDGSAHAAITGVLFFLSLFACVLLHEYGHALMARRFGIGTRDITLLPIGGVARLDRMPDRPVHELWVALAGPSMNVVIAAGLAIWLTLAEAWQPFTSLTTTSGSLLERLLAVNVFLVLFNLLPAFPMDGGRVLRALLALRLESARATRIAATIGQGMAVLFGFAGLFGNPMLLFIALFVWIGASQEAAAAEMKSSFADVPVRAAMLTRFHTLPPTATIGEAGHLLLADSQRDFPVVDDNRVVGLLGHADLFRALRERDEDAPVAAVMRRDLPFASADEDLAGALARGTDEKGLAMPVLADGRLVGLLTAENVGEFMLLQAARTARRDSRPILAPPLLRRAAGLK